MDNRRSETLFKLGIRFSRSKKEDANYLRLEKIPVSQLNSEQKKFIDYYTNQPQSSNLEDESQATDGDDSSSTDPDNDLLLN